MTHGVNDKVTQNLRIYTSITARKLSVRKRNQTAPAIGRPSMPTNDRKTTDNYGISIA